jgi:hypothetical protein
MSKHLKALAIAIIDISNIILACIATTVLCVVAVLILTDGIGMRYGVLMLALSTGYLCIAHKIEELINKSNFKGQIL